MDPATLVDYAKSLDCIHCGLCLRTCPTYRLSGAEASSPRGRIHLMRSLAEGELEVDAGFEAEMDFCLLCRHCESVCPSGVHFGAMMETTRAGLAARGAKPWWTRVLRHVGFRVLLPRRALMRAATSLLRLGQRSGALRLFAPLLGERGKALLSFHLAPARRERALLPERTAPAGARAGSVALLEGCVMPELLPGVNRASARVLAAAGYEVRTTRAVVCCGSLHAHNGDLQGARALGRKLVASFDELRDETGRPLEVVVNSAGCGAHMKELGELLSDDGDWSERARAFSARVLDLGEFLAQRAQVRLGAALRRDPGLALPLAFDDPCHLCHGQGIRAEPRALLDLLPGARRIEVEDSESCCGSAGIYSLLRPADSRAILAEKLDALERSGARTLVTANPGCHLQWLAGVKEKRLQVEVLHLAEALERAL